MPVRRACPDELTGKGLTFGIVQPATGRPRPLPARLATPKTRPAAARSGGMGAIRPPGSPARLRGRRPRSRSRRQRVRHRRRVGTSPQSLVSAAGHHSQQVTQRENLVALGSGGRKRVQMHLGPINPSSLPYSDSASTVSGVPPSLRRTVSPGCGPALAPACRNRRP